MISHRTTRKEFQNSRNLIGVSNSAKSCFTQICADVKHADLRRCKADFHGIKEQQNLLLSFLCILKFFLCFSV